MKVDVAKVFCERFYERCAEPFENPEVVSAFFDRIVKSKWGDRITAYNISVSMNKMSEKNRGIYIGHAKEIARAGFAVDDFCDNIVEGGENTLDNLLSYLKK
jgi:hypothetical protein